MNLTRRDAILSLAAGAAATCLPAITRAAQPAADPKPDAGDFLIWKPVGDGAFVGVGSGGNSTVIKGKDAGILVDCKNAPYGQCLRREALRRCGSLAMVINTHHHGDHTGGNHAFSADVEIVAQDACTERVLGQMNRYLSQLKEASIQLGDGDGPTIRQVRGEALELYQRKEKLKPTDFAPKTTFATSREIAAAGIVGTMHHFGAGHTDNDLVIHLPELNVLILGDLLFNKMHPFVDKESGADTRAWQAALRKCLDLCDAKTIVVPGHGDLAGVAAIKTQIAYFDALRDFVAAALKEGKSRSEIANMAMPKFGDYGLKQMASSGLMTMHDELKAEGGK